MCAYAQAKMVLKRKISKDKYILAAIFTILLFTLGYAFGRIFDSERILWLEQRGTQQELDLRSIQFQYLYLTTSEDEAKICPVLQATLKKTITDLSNSLEKYQDYKSSSLSDPEDYSLVGRRYALDNFNYWMLARKAKAACGLDVVTILYFYKKNCDICPNQGVILTYFKNVFGDKLLIFPVDGDLSSVESAIDIIQSRFNVTSYPTIIVEDQKFEGIIEKDQLRKVICHHFHNETSC